MHIWPFLPLWVWKNSVQNGLRHLVFWELFSVYCRKKCLFTALYAHSHYIPVIGNYQKETSPLCSNMNVSWLAGRSCPWSCHHRATGRALSFFAWTDSFSPQNSLPGRCYIGRPVLQMRRLRFREITHLSIIIQLTSVKLHKDDKRLFEAQICVFLGRSMRMLCHDNHQPKQHSSAYLGNLGDPLLTDLETNFFFSCQRFLNL